MEPNNLIVLTRSGNVAAESGEPQVLRTTIKVASCLFVAEYKLSKLLDFLVMLDANMALKKADAEE